MSIRQKYKKLQNTGFVANMIINSAYGNMCLEGQGIDKNKVKQMYYNIQSEKITKGLRELQTF